MSIETSRLGRVNSVGVTYVLASTQFSMQTYRIACCVWPLKTGHSYGVRPHALTASIDMSLLRSDAAASAIQLRQHHNFDNATALRFSRGLSPLNKLISLNHLDRAVFRE